MLLSEMTEVEDSESVSILKSAACARDMFLRVKSCAVKEHFLTLSRRGHSLVTDCYALVATLALYDLTQRNQIKCVPTGLEKNCRLEICRKDDAA